MPARIAALVLTILAWRGEAVQLRRSALTSAVPLGNATRESARSAVSALSSHSAFTSAVAAGNATHGAVSALSSRSALKGAVASGAGKCNGECHQLIVCNNYAFDISLDAFFTPYYGRAHEDQMVLVKNIPYPGCALSKLMDETQDQKNYDLGTISFRVHGSKHVLGEAKYHLGEDAPGHYILALVERKDVFEFKPKVTVMPVPKSATKSYVPMVFHDSYKGVSRGSLMIFETETKKPVNLNKKGYALQPGSVGDWESFDGSRRVRQKFPAKAGDLLVVMLIGNEPKRKIKKHYKRNNLVAWSRIDGMLWGYHCEDGVVGLGCPAAVGKTFCTPGDVTCGEHGECAADGTHCVCDPGWTGPICDQATGDGGASGGGGNGTGTGTGNGTGLPLPPWEAGADGKPFCSPGDGTCGEFGECHTDGTHCVCDPGWTGPRCETPTGGGWGGGGNGTQVPYPDDGKPLVPYQDYERPLGTDSGLLGDVKLRSKRSGHYLHGVEGGRNGDACIQWSPDTDGSTWEVERVVAPGQWNSTKGVPTKETARLKNKRSGNYLHQTNPIPWLGQASKVVQWDSAADSGSQWEVEPGGPGTIRLKQPQNDNYLHVAPGRQAMGDDVTYQNVGLPPDEGSEWIVEIINPDGSGTGGANGTAPSGWNATGYSPALEPAPWESSNATKGDEGWHPLPFQSSDNPLLPTCVPSCEPHGRCDEKTLTCICDPGWVGDSCDEQVEKPWDAAVGRPDGGGTGATCSDELCAPHGICDEASGKCECDIGYTGEFCADKGGSKQAEERDGSVTEDWDEDWKCTDELCAPHGRCDEASGKCVCDDGWAGKTCKDSAIGAAAAPKEEDSGWPWWLWWLLLLALICCCCCCCAGGGAAAAA